MTGDAQRNLAKVASWFTAIVRERGMPLAGRNAIRIEESSPVTLFASVQGTERYRAQYQREGHRLLCYCSCPFFQDRRTPCKHLYALALEQSDSDLLRGAVNEVRTLTPRTLALDEDDFEKIYEDDDVEEEDDVEEDPRARAIYPRLAGDWRGAAARVVARRQSQVQVRREELVYFLSPSLSELGTSVVIACRKIDGDAGDLSPLSALSAPGLEHALDRELYAMLTGLSHRAAMYAFGGAGMHLARVGPLVATAVLERLARSERCYLVPADLRGSPLAKEWSALASGERLGRKARKELGYDFGKLLDWPQLRSATNDGYRLYLGLEADGRQRKQRAFSVVGALVRGEEQRALAEVSYCHPEGLAIVGDELVHLRPQDAMWLGAILAEGALGRVAEQDLQEFVERFLGHDGVSGLSLPEGYEKVALDPPRPTLDFAAPEGKRLRATLSFDYAGRRVSAEQRAHLLFENEKVLLRHAAAEEQALRLLSSLGFSGELLSNARTPGIGINERELPRAVRTLLGEGWSVSAAGKRYRSAQGFDVQVESGIDWLEVKGVARFSGGEVPFPALLAAIKRRSSFVQLGDGSWGMLPEEWLSRWGMFAELPTPKGEGLRFSSRQLGLVQALCAALPADDSGARGLGQLRARLAEFERVKPAKAPRGFRGKLRSYQEQGLGWLTALGELGFGACLADDMGLGKTIQVLAYLQATKDRRKNKPALVVVPRSLLGNWLDEAARFAPKLIMESHFGPERKRSKSALASADVLLTTYGTLRLDISLFSELELDCVVLDEAQAIKNKQSATAKCVKLLRAERRVAMSGTPVENHLGELWSLFEFLNPGLLDELGGLRRALESPRPSTEVLELVRTLVKPFVLRRTKGEVAKDLPERSEQTLYIEREPDERRAYDELLTHYQASLSKELKQAGPERTTSHLLEALLRLRQAACHPGLLDAERRTEPSAKVDFLVERLRALREEGHRALIFSQFTSLLAIVRERLETHGIPFEYLDGQTRDRQARVDRFQADSSITAFLISLKAGGVGLNLTGADYVFILDPWWNPAAEAQAIDRAHRIGQTRHVIAYRLLAKGTVEERVAHLQEQKRELVAGIMGDGEALSTRLTREDFEALLSLTAQPALSAPNRQ